MATARSYPPSNQNYPIANGGPASNMQKTAPSYLSAASAPVSSVMQAGPKRVLCVADVRGNLRSLNELASQARADYIIHTGDFGFYDEESLKRIADKTLKHVAQYSPLLTENQKRIIQTSQPQQYDVKSRFSPHELQLSELGQFIKGQQKLNVPVFTVWGACEDVRVLEKFRTGEYKIPNLHIIDESSSKLLELGGVKLRLLGLGGAVVMHKLFDNGEGRATIAGGQGTMWTTLLQMGELVDTATRAYDPTETRIFVTHASPAREGLLNQLSVTLKADFSISAGLHFRYGSSYNEFSVNPTLEHYRGKLAASKASFNDVWETVRSEVEPAVAGNDAQQILLQNALEIVNKMPSSVSSSAGYGSAVGPNAAGASQPSVDESAFKNMWNFNLADAAFGYLVLELQDGRIGTEMTAQGFNFAHRTSGIKPPMSGTAQPAISQPNIMPSRPGVPSGHATSVNSGNQHPQYARQTGPVPTQQQAIPARTVSHAQLSQQQQQQQVQPGQQSNVNVDQNKSGVNVPRGPATPAAGPGPVGPITNSSISQPNSTSASTANRTAVNSQQTRPGNVHANGTGDKSEVDRRQRTRLFLPNVDSEQAARDNFNEEDKAKIIKMEHVGNNKSTHIIHFATTEDAEAALKRQHGVPRVGGRGTITARWFIDHKAHSNAPPRNRDASNHYAPSNANQSQNPEQTQTQNRAGSISGSTPSVGAAANVTSASRQGYQSGASDSEGARGGHRGGHRGGRGGRGSHRGSSIGTAGTGHRASSGRQTGSGNKSDNDGSAALKSGHDGAKTALNNAPSNSTAPSASASGPTLVGAEKK